MCWCKFQVVWGSCACWQIVSSWIVWMVWSMKLQSQTLGLLVLMTEFLNSVCNFAFLDILIPRDSSWHFRFLLSDNCVQVLLRLNRDRSLKITRFYSHACPSDQERPSPRHVQTSSTEIAQESYRYQNIHICYNFHELQQWHGIETIIVIGIIFELQY